MIWFADGTESPRNRVAEEPSSVVNTNEMGEMWEPWECGTRDAARAEMLQVGGARLSPTCNFASCLLLGFVVGRQTPCRPQSWNSASAVGEANRQRQIWFSWAGRRR